MCVGAWGNSFLNKLKRKLEGLGDDAMMDDDDDEGPPPEDPRDMAIHPDILEDVRQRAKVFVGEGKSLMDDRVHIRDCLSLVTGQVRGDLRLAVLVPHAWPTCGISDPSGTVFGVCALQVTQGGRVSSGCAIKEIVVFAPCEMLQGQIQWIDAAGCNDSDTLKIKQRAYYVRGVARPCDL